MGRKEEIFGEIMTTHVRKMRENFALRSEIKRKERDEKWVEKLNKTWGSLIEDKKQEAGDLPFRFAYTYTMAEDRSYYTLVEDGDARLVFMDINRDRNTGVRQCVVLLDEQIALLATVKPLGWEARDKHRWEVVDDNKLRKIHLENIYGSLKNAPVFDPQGQLYWKGLYPDTAEVLKTLHPDVKE
ncbi:MAG: hypothetical protein KBC00_00870 [Candidatus Levybacteria bacterium]|nr:hypothetical protein [Candidatus Levybacteria bacterium]MBP9814741.1 hypothetical protein [Candidatus Levybacteria bacterium]